MGCRCWLCCGTFTLNLLRWKGFYSIRSGLIAVAHDISGMLGWVGISTTKTGWGDFRSYLAYALGRTHPGLVLVKADGSRDPEQMREPAKSQSP